MKTNVEGNANRPSARKSFYLFLPKRLDRAAFIRWLKRVHAWTGFWGALAFLLLGVSGVLLNHKSVAKINTGAPQEVSSVVLTIDPQAIASPADLGAWAQQEFGTQIKPSARRGSAASNGPVMFLGREVDPAQIWKQRFFAPNAILMVEYVPGSTSVKVVKSAQNGWGLIKNLHKASGLGILWVLLFDTMAGALIAMTLTGTLLWTRLHGPRVLAGGIALSSLGLMLTAAMPRMI